MLWRLVVTLAGYLVAWTLGLFVAGPYALWLIVTRRVRIKGYWNLVAAVLKGRTMILMNHPSLFYETILIVAVLFPWYLFFPRAFIWSLPDRRLLDQWGMKPWMRVLLRCIELDRSDRIVNGHGGVNATEVLKIGWVVAGHPEAGRTFGDANRKREPLSHGYRQMQKIESKLTLVAYKSGAQILAGWVEVNDPSPVSVTTSFRRMFGRNNRRHRPVTFYFRRSAYRPAEPFDLDRENKRLQDEIFSA